MTSLDERARIESLPIAILNPPSLILNTLSLLHVEIIKDLLDLDLERVSNTRGVGRGKVDALRQLHKEAWRLCSNAETSDAQEISTTTLLEELTAVGVDLDAPWASILVHLDRRTRNVFEREGFFSLRDIVVRHEAGSLPTLTGFGSTSSKRLQSAFDSIVTHGLDQHHFGTSGRPEMIDEALALVEAELDDDHLLMLQMRFFEGATLEQIATRLELSRERVRQRIDAILERARSFIGGVLKELLSPMLMRIDRQGGLISLSDAVVLADGLEPARVVLALAMLGCYAKERATGFLCVQDALEFERIASTWRTLLMDLKQASIGLSNARELAAKAGWRLRNVDIARLARALWKVERHGDALLNPWLQWPERYTQILQDATHPMSLEDLSAQVQGMLGLLEPPGDRQVASALKRAPKVFCINRGMYVHQDALPMELGALNVLAKECIDALEGKDHAVSVRVFIEELRAQERVPWRVTPMLLHDIMARNEQIQTFQSTDLVAHRASFSGDRVTQAQHVEELLLDSSGPMTCDEVHSSLPEYLNFSRDAVYMTLLHKHFALNLGQGRFIHREAVGLTERLCQRVARMGMELLPKDGSPTSAKKILEQLEVTPAVAFLRVSEHGVETLWALVRAEDGVRSGSGGWLMLERDGRQDAPLLEAAMKVMREHVLMTPADIRSMLHQAYEVEPSTSTLYAILERAEEGGHIVRVQGSLRALATRTKEEIRVALSALASSS